MVIGVHEHHYSAPFGVCHCASGSIHTAISTTAFSTGAGISTAARTYG